MNKRKNEAIKNYWLLMQMPYPDDDWIEYEEKTRERQAINLDTTSTEQSLIELNILDFIIKTPSIKYLDVGCGYGGSVASLAEKNFSGTFHGLDPSGIRIGFAQKEFKNQKNLFLYEDTVENIKFEENYFDIIINTHVIEHTRDPILVLKKIRKWLKPNGYLIIGGPNVDGIIPRLNVNEWRQAVYGHFWLPGKKSLFHILKNEGFKIEKYFTYGGFPAPRNFVKEILNKLFKLLNIGDSIMILAKKTNERMEYASAQRK